VVVLEQLFHLLKEALVVDQLPDKSTSIPHNGDLRCNAHLKDLEFPEVSGKNVGQIIGICSAELHELREIRRGGQDEQWAGHTPLGWVVYGDIRLPVKIKRQTLTELETKFNFANLCTPPKLGLDQLFRRHYALDWSENCYTEALTVAKEDKKALDVA